MAGGSLWQVAPIEPRKARWDACGERILYAEREAEIFYRKHDYSPFARDLWSLDIATGRQELTFGRRGTPPLGFPKARDEHSNLAGM